MTPEKQLQWGTRIIHEFAAFNPEEKADFPEDLDCLKLWLKAKLLDYGADIDHSEEMQASVEMGLEAAYRFGKLKSQ